MAVHYEILIKGKEKHLRAYLDGYMRGKGIKEGYFYSKDEPIDLRPIRDLIKYHGDVLHLICESNLRTTIKAAIRQAPNEHEFEIVKDRKITRGYFHFQFYTANRRSAGTIKRLLGALPEGAELVDFSPKEIERPDAEGTELYTPVHHYVYRGKGVVEGDVAAVYETHRRMEANEFFSCKKIEIHH